MGEQVTCWIDHEYDREHAAAGSSRYAELVGENVGAFEGSWGDIAPVSFACAAWRLATMASPGYVRLHRRVLSADCDRNSWDGTLTAHVRLASPLPAQLTGSRQWWRDRGWREWPQMVGQYLDPTDRDQTRNPFLRPVLLVDAPIPFAALPPAPDGPSKALADTAMLAVAVLVRELNDLLDPIVEQLETAEAPG